LTTGLDTPHRIFIDNPDDRRAFEALEEHFFLEGEWEPLVDLYRKRLAAPSVEADPALQSPLLYRLGQILEERILDLEAASEVYWQLARREPGNRAPLRQLRGIYERSEQWDLVLQIAELEGQTEMPPYERAVFESDLGQIWKQHLADADEARRAYERAIAADPDHPAALDGLAALDCAAGRYAEAARGLERLAERLRGPERAPTWITLGGLYAGPLADPERAAACFDRALEDDPFQTSAVEWGLMLATASESWETVAELLERRFDLAAGARHRAAIAVEASQIQLHHLDSPAAARAWIERAVELCHEDPAVLLARTEVERADGDARALLGVLDELIAIGGRFTPRRALLEAAQLHADLGHGEQALGALERASDKPGPDDGEVLELQIRLLRDSGAKRELAEALETLTALAEGDDSTSVAEPLRELARLYEEDLGEPASAQAAWQRAFALEPAHPESQDALERVYRKDRDWSALRELLATAIEIAGAPQRPALFARLGDLLLSELDDPGEARRCFEAALEDPASTQAALAGLRRIAERGGDDELLLEVCEREAADCVDPAAMGELARSALPILEARGETGSALEWAARWCRLAPESREALERRAGYEERLGRRDEEIESRRALVRLQSGRERMDDLRRLASLHLEREEHEAAATALEQAREHAPRDPEILATLCDVYRELERPRELAQCLREHVDALPDDEQAEPLEELAEILQGALGDVETAIVVRWQLADLPAPPEDALAKLEALLESAGRYAELSQLLDTHRRQLGDHAPEAFDLDLRRARLRLDALGHCEEAAEIFAALHERHPDDERVLDDLERALRVGDDARGLCDLLERRANWTEDAERAVAIQFERAALLEESLAEPLAACELYETIAREHPGTDHARRAHERLEAVLEAKGEWARLRELLEARLDESSVDDEPALRERIALLCRERLQDVAGCADHYEAIARLTPAAVHVWQELQAIYAHQLDRPSDWLRVVEAELAIEPAPDREFSLRVGAARLCLDDERRPEDHEASEAYDHYERVLALEPQHAEAAEVLASYYAGADRPADAARVLEARLTSLADTQDAARADLHLRLGRLYLDALEAPDRAREHFEAARSGMGTPDALAEPLARLHEQAGDDEALAGLCRAVLEAPDADAIHALPWRVRLGKAEHGLGQLEAAAVAYRAALVDSPDDREIEDALIEIYRESEETEPLIDLLEKRLPYAPSEEAIALRLELAELQDASCGEPGEALAQLECVLEIHPQHRDALDRAMAIAERLGDSERQLCLMDRGLELALSKSERAELLERRGHLIEEALGDPERALPSFREALALDRERGSVRMALRRLLEDLERWPAVLDCLFLEASASEASRRIEVLEEACEIAWEHVGPDAALPWLTRLRAERPEDPDLVARMGEAHRRAGRFEATLRALDQEISLRSSDSTACCKLHLRRAQLLEHDLHVPGRAILAYQQALELDPAQQEALCELDRLYESMDRPFERAAILETRCKELDEEAGFEMRQTLAGLYCGPLSRPELAVPHLLRNVAAKRGEPGEEIGPLGALDAALRSSGRFDAWARVAERELELIAADLTLAERTPPGYVRFLREELARVYDEELGRPDRAITELRALIETCPSSNPQAGERLRALLRRTGDRHGLALALVSQLESGEGDAADWLELGTLREEALLDLNGAALAYREASRDERVAPAAIRGLRRCTERLRDWTGLAEALELALEDETRLGPGERCATARRLGDVCWRRLAEGERASAAYEQALEIDPTSLEVLRALTSVREACDASQEAAALYRRELELLADEPDTEMRCREIWLRLAALHGELTEEPRAAIEAYHEADRIQPLCARDQLELAQLCDAAGDLEGYFEAFGMWCDREDSEASVGDHIELARRLLNGQAQHGREAARERIRRASEVDPQEPAAWLFLAELERDAEAPEKAADAFEQAARFEAPDAACRHLMQAAEVIDHSDLSRAHALMARAVAAEPGCVEARVALMRAADRAGELQDVAREAELVLGLPSAAELEEKVRQEVALLGGRAARSLDQPEAARRLFAILLEIDPDHVEALETLAEAHFEQGDHREARALLERRLEQPGSNPERATHLAMIGRGLESEALLDAAWSRYEEAVELDPRLEIACEGLVRIHERTGRTDEALQALERWVEISEDPARRAQAALRAAELSLAADESERAQRHLEIATRSAPELADAWWLLCELVAAGGSDRETRRICNEALESIKPGPLASRIALRLAQLEEQAGHREAARRRYAEAASWEPRSIEAALSESRLARLAGEWDEAEATLRRFAEAHPDPESPSLAHVFLERGRLLSGPLERFDEAISAYQQALALQPDLDVARNSLAGLLIHVPERQQEALALHRSILERSPTTASSLRALASLATRMNRGEIAGDVLVVLRALGQASPQEAAEAPRGLRTAIQPGPPMSETESERLRRLAHLLRDELSPVLAEVDVSLPSCSDPEVAETLKQIAAIEAELTAERLPRMATAERAALFATIASLFLDPGGNGGDVRYRESLDHALGRWTRRRARRLVEETSVAAIEALDHEAWGNELRAIAAGQVMDRSGGDLRSTLRALLVLEGNAEADAHLEGAQLGTLAATSESTRRLLLRINTQLCDRLAECP
jgi:tetratricopeptide (TPR) repeat protein